MLIISSIFLLLILIIDFFLLSHFISALISTHYGDPYVSLPSSAVKIMIDFIPHQPQQIADLGCGDGRLLFAAISKFPQAQASGYEIAPWPYLKAQLKRFVFPYRQQIKFYRQNFFSVPLNDFDLLLLYLTSSLLKKLAPKLEKELPPRARIITARYPIPQWKAEKVFSPLPGFNFYLYEIKKSNLALKQ